MKISYIELLGKQYPLCFSLSATKALSDKFGDLTAMQKKIGDADLAVQADAICSMLSILLEAGQRYCRVAGLDCPPPLECDVGDVIDLSDPSAVTAIFAAISGGNKREVEVAESKNAEAKRGK